MNEKNKAGQTPLQVLLGTIKDRQDFAATRPSAQAEVDKLHRVAELFGYKGDTPSKVTK